MVALLGSLLGFITSIFPEILKTYRNKIDRQHELEVLDRQIEFSKLNHHHRLEEIEVTSHTKLYEALYHHAQPTGITWVDGLAGSVRPTITYAFFGLYAAIKVAMWSTYHHQGCSWATALLSLWGTEDQALFATVVSFWFGQRLLHRGKMGGYR